MLILKEASHSSLKSSKIKFEWLLLLPIILSTYILFRQSLSYYFFQDDWFVLNWVQQGNLLSFFDFRTDIIYWRPLSMPLFFFIGNKLFGLNPIGFHIISFLFHITNAILIFILFKTLGFKLVISFLISLMYASAAFHFISISWLSTTSYIVGPTFIFLAIIFFLKEKFIACFVTFILAMASSELALTTIPIIFVLKNFEKKTFLKLLPCAVIAFLYLILRFVIFPIPRSGQYEIGLNQTTLVNLFWYGAWALNIPEKLATIFFVTNLKNSLAETFRFYQYIILPAIFAFYIAAFVIVKKIDYWNISKSFLIFLFGILPVLFVPKHTYPMYVTIASIGIFYLIATCVNNAGKYQKIIVAVFAIIWFFSAYATINFTKHSHWVVNQQNIAKSYLDFTKKKVNNPKNNSYFVFKPADDVFSNKNGFVLAEAENNIKQSLNDQDAVHVFFNNKSLNSYYSAHLKPIKLPEGSEAYEIYPSKDE